MPIWRCLMSHGSLVSAGPQPSHRSAFSVQQVNFAAAGQGVRVSAEGDPVADGRQGGDLVAGAGRVTRLAAPPPQLMWPAMSAPPGPVAGFRAGS